MATLRISHATSSEKDESCGVYGEAGKNYEIINTQFHDYAVRKISTTTHFRPTHSKIFAINQLNAQIFVL